MFLFPQIHTWKPSPQHGGTGGPLGMNRVSCSPVSGPHSGISALVRRGRGKAMRPVRRCLPSRKGPRPTLNPQAAWRSALLLGFAGSALLLGMCHGTCTCPVMVLGWVSRVWLAVAERSYTFLYMFSVGVFSLLLGQYLAEQLSCRREGQCSASWRSALPCAYP